MSTFGERLADMVGDAPLRENDATFADGWREARTAMWAAADMAQDVHGTHSITLSNIARMMLDLLRKTIAEEPPAPDPDELDTNSAYFEELARKHGDWARQVGACYLMLNAQLRTLIEEQLL